jgi:hypothetical protein
MLQVARFPLMANACNQHQVAGLVERVARPLARLGLQPLAVTGQIGKVGADITQFMAGSAGRHVAQGMSGILRPCVTQPCAAYRVGQGLNHEGV